MLKKLIAPMDEDEFFSKYWEKKAMLITRNDPEYFSDLISMDIVDKLITGRKLKVPFYLSITSKKNLLADNSLLDKRRMFEYYSKGETLILQLSQHYWGPLRDFCMNLQNYFKCKHIDANLYLTPANNQGFKPHYDPMSSFIAQIHGTKHWKLHHTPIKLPFEIHRLRGEKWTKGVETTAPSMEFDLHPGDTLYIPRGLVHEATAQNKACLHITLGLTEEFIWQDLLHRMVDSLFMGRPEFDRPLSFMQNLGENINSKSAMTSEEMSNSLQNAIEKMFRPSSLDNAVNSFLDEKRSNQAVFCRNELHMLDDLDNLTLETVIKPRYLFDYCSSKSGNQTVLSFHGRSFAFNPPELAAFQYVMSKESCKVKELPGVLNDEAKLSFVKTLVIICAVTFDPSAL